jgi:CHAT domain-containing protein
MAVHYLIEDIPISYLSSASLLKTLREAQARRKSPASYPVIAFAHPDYTALTTGEHSSAETQTPLPAEGGERSFHELRLQAYQGLLEGTIPELPETAEEANAIARLLNAPSKSDPLQLRDKASRANVFAFNAKERLDDYQYVIFATHGVLPGEVSQITQSALVLADDFLTMADVFALKLNAKMVALSACNTGGGKQVRGEGIMGLTRAFMYAGTPTIAVTLWSVESLSAKELDIGLFEALKSGQPPVQALRAIKLRMLRGDKGATYQHPYYWAPFVLFGDGS